MEEEAAKRCTRGRAGLGGLRRRASSGCWSLAATWIWAACKPPSRWTTSPTAGSLPSDLRAPPSCWGPQLGVCLGPPLHTQDRTHPETQDLLEGRRGLQRLGGLPSDSRTEAWKGQDCQTPQHLPTVSSEPRPLTLSPPTLQGHSLALRTLGKVPGLLGVGILGFWGGPLAGFGREGVRFFCMTVVCCSALCNIKWKDGGFRPTFCHVCPQDQAVQALSGHRPSPPSWLVGRPPRASCLA